MIQDNPPTLQDVFTYVESVYRNCRLMIQDSVHELRIATKCHFEHVYKWDYTQKASDHFLIDGPSCPSRCWVTYRPIGELGRGVLFSLQFHAVKRVVEPSLIFGSVLIGPNGQDTLNRWVAFNSIVHAEEGRPGIKVSKGDPLVTVAGDGVNIFSEAVLVRVPLESLHDTDSLQRIVVAPLASLVRGDRAGAERELAGITTLPWPVETSEAEESEPTETGEQS